MSEFDMDDLFEYEGRFCWPVAAASGAVGMAMLAAVTCLVWRGASELGWVRFDHGGAIAVMVIGCALGAVLGVVEHAERHWIARYLDAHPELVRPGQDDERDGADRDEQPAGDAR